MHSSAAASAEFPPLDLDGPAPDEEVSTEVESPEPPVRSGATTDEPYHLQVAPGNGVAPCARYPVDLHVTLRWAGRDRRRTAVDVSAEGLFVESPDHVAAGELIQIVSVLPGGPVLRGLCTVERVVSPGEAAFCGGMPGMGLRFFLMDSSLKAKWAMYVHQLAAGTLPEPADPERREHMPDVPRVTLTRRGGARKLGRFRVRMRTEGSLRDFFTQNVSRGGMFIAHPKPLPEGDMLSLFIVHPVTGREFALQAEVRWTQAEGNGLDSGMGVKLIDCSEDEFLEFVNVG